MTSLANYISTSIHKFFLRPFSSLIEEEVKLKVNQRIEEELNKNLRKEIKKTLFEMAKGTPEVKQELNVILLEDVKNNKDTFDVIASKLEYEFYKIEISYSLYFKNDMIKYESVDFKSWGELYSFVKKMSSLGTNPFEEYPGCLGFNSVSLLYMFKFLGDVKSVKWNLTEVYGSDVYPTSDFWHCMYRISTALSAYPELLI